MREIETKLTRELRGDVYAQGIVTLQEAIADKRSAIEGLKTSLAEANVDAVTKAMLNAKILDASDRIFDNLAEIERIRVSQAATSNKAATELARLKGAYDPRRKAEDDPDALANQTLQNILRSGWKPRDLLEHLISQAEDVEFSVEPNESPAVGRLGAKGPQSSPGPGLFIRDPSYTETD